jgi:hypothetical protein
VTTLNNTARPIASDVGAESRLSASTTSDVDHVEEFKQYEDLEARGCALEAPRPPASAGLGRSHPFHAEVVSHLVQQIRKPINQIDPFHPPTES